MSNSSYALAAGNADHKRLKVRIESLLDLTLLAKGELHNAVYRAHLAGVPDETIVHLACLKPGELTRIIESFRAMPEEVLEDEMDAKQLVWRLDNGIGTFG